MDDDTSAWSPPGNTPEDQTPPVVPAPVAPGSTPRSGEGAPPAPPPNPQPAPYPRPGPQPAPGGYASYNPPGPPGWWLASDGNWYPPQSAVGYPPRTNGMAIASMVLGILWLYWIGSVLALVFGYIARRQIQESRGNQGGAGMATAGIVLGWIGVGILSLFFVFIIITAIGASAS